MEEAWEFAAVSEDSLDQLKNNSPVESDVANDSIPNQSLVMKFLKKFDYSNLVATLAFFVSIISTVFLYQRTSALSATLKEQALIKWRVFHEDGNLVFNTPNSSQYIGDVLAFQVFDKSLIVEPENFPRSAAVPETVLFEKLSSLGLQLIFQKGQNSRDGILFNTSTVRAYVEGLAYEFTNSFQNQHNISLSDFNVVALVPITVATKFSFDGNFKYDCSIYIVETNVDFNSKIKNNQGKISPKNFSSNVEGANFFERVKSSKNDEACDHTRLFEASVEFARPVFRSIKNSTSFEEAK